MSAGEFHKSGLTRIPPSHNSHALPDVSAHVQRYGDGRIGWPTIVQYEYAGKFHDVPPAEHGVGFQVAVHDVLRYDTLVATGLIYQTSHTGREWSEILEKAK